MSYARSGADGSDVYVYAVDRPGFGGVVWHCCGCDVDTPTPAGMAVHLRKHRSRGERVPQYTMDALAADQAALDDGRELRYGA